MPDEEFARITPQKLTTVPDPRSELFDTACLPQDTSILEEVFQAGGEVSRARQDSQYVGIAEGDLKSIVTELINACLGEMSSYEAAARLPTAQRLESLKKIAPTIRRVVVLSAPGDYRRLDKPDRYRDDPVMQGADRLRSDQAAILAIVLAGIKAGWPDNELLLFLNQHILPAKSDELYQLKEKTRKTLQDSGIRLVYTGRQDEIEAVKRALAGEKAFIPKGCVDILGPEDGDTTLGQTKLLKKYLEGSIEAGDAFILPINLQGIRAMRMANSSATFPKGGGVYIYAMPTSVKSDALPYRRREVRGIVFSALTKRATFDPAPHQII